MQATSLDPVGTLPVPQVVSRLCGVQTQVAPSAELAIRVRRKTSRRGEVARALTDGRLIKTWAMQRYFGVTPKQLDLLRETVRIEKLLGGLAEVEVDGEREYVTADVRATAGRPRRLPACRRAQLLIA